MNRRLLRRCAFVVLAGLIPQLSGTPLVLAANGSVRGRITLESGSLPPGATVRATPLDGGGPSILADVKADLSYAFPQLPEGAYLFEVIGPDGTVLGSGTPTLVPPGALQLNLRVKPTAPKPPVPEDVPSTTTPGTTPAPGRADEREPKPPLSTGKKWAVWGSIIGGLGVGLAAGGGDGNGSPSQP